MKESEIFFIGMERKWERDRCSEMKVGRKEFSVLENEISILKESEILRRKHGKQTEINSEWEGLEFCHSSFN